MSRKNKREYPDDDGRTIADMNVEGMPWYVKSASGRREETPPSEAKEPMTREETRGYIWAAVRAGLLVAAVFAAAYGLFLLFCEFVWFR